jgi:hypothetical protein
MEISTERKEEREKRRMKPTADRTRKRERERERKRETVIKRLRNDYRERCAVKYQWEMNDSDERRSDGKKKREERREEERVSTWVCLWSPLLSFSLSLLSSLFLSSHSTARHCYKLVFTSSHRYSLFRISIDRTVRSPFLLSTPFVGLIRVSLHTAHLRDRLVMGFIAMGVNECGGWVQRKGEDSQTALLA